MAKQLIVSPEEQGTVQMRAKIPGAMLQVDYVKDPDIRFYVQKGGKSILLWEIKV